MGRLNIKWKIMMPVYAIILVFMVGMAAQLAFVGNNAARIEEMYDRYFTAISKADDLKLNIVQVQQWLTDIGATRAAEGFDDGFDEAEAHAQNVRTLLRELKSLTPENGALLDEVEEKFEPYYQIGKEMADAYIAQGPRGGNAMMGDFDEAAAQLNEQVGVYIGKADSDVQNSIRNIYDANRKIKVLTLAIVAVALLVSIKAGIVIRDVLIRPILELNDMAKEMVRGNLSAKSQHVSEDELGELTQEMNQTAVILSGYIKEITRYIEELKNGDLRGSLKSVFQGDFTALGTSIQYLGNAQNAMMKQINITSDAVSSGAEQVAQSAQMLAHGSEEQNCSIERLQKTIEMTTKESVASSESAEAASERVNEVGKVARISNEQMREMVDAMEKISQSSGEIGKIIKTIDDIAFQTNILALNAAVEAARAGAAGKGFAVVADEVRNLASKSAEAAKNTTTLIEESVQAVEHGVDIADRTAESLKAVFSGVTEVVSGINGIAEAARKQTADMEEIKKEIDEISAVTQNISATAEENGAASEELSGQSDQLKELVNQFKLRD